MATDAGKATYERIQVIMARLDDAGQQEFRAFLESVAWSPVTSRVCGTAKRWLRDFPEVEN